MGLRYKTPREILQRIGLTKDKAAKLIAEAEELDHLATALFQKGSEHTDYARHLRECAERARARSAQLLERRIPNLTRKLAEMNTLPMTPIIGDDISVPVLVR